MVRLKLADLPDMGLLVWADDACSLQRHRANKLRRQMRFITHPRAVDFLLFLNDFCVHLLLAACDRAFSLDV
jgi:hypothetical protein